MRLDICSQRPATYDEATGDYTLGHAEVDVTRDGRLIEVGAVNDAPVTAAGTATHWALTDGEALVAAWTLLAPTRVQIGATWDLSAFAHTVEDDI